MVIGIGEWIQRQNKHTLKTLLRLIIENVLRLLLFLLLLLIIIIIKSILRSAQQKKEGQMTFLFKFLAGLRGLEPRLTGPESVVLPIER